ncbi:carboxymuconolactone decarboxylase family protein [Streptomyces europaeiscabiei]|uniref:carboxymuconolactone decarboxylase family protein n=1 Tax=Streptomyces TaxID=1883 RepID=UPI000A365201|nr:MULTISPECIES: carboxymuconolactone decarboxylase family protein [Streptomyces]MDX3588519.1 carboxymuconolactone decarboxylase family protein [Streptomyces europaeiscabiei]MDX3612143.1 carboxymuconolactone decarboxylase family protein [Streptomyces europaeiscabiei]MDX3630374.1 carboxymuconolactone decarboxylase family protein [Streptomyces europaeiscabiei]MDX3648511.1 carboxymuconolactone decarboxylase family protein [Streptomyces europaeiscabiei]WUD30970.1 carboxymuconolactone decarboxylase
MSEKPRLQPVDEADLQEKTLASLAPYRDQDGRIYTIWATLAHHEDALRRYLVFSNHVLGKNTLPLRSRELMILRIAARAQAAYEWDQHVRIARRAGLADETILAAAAGDWDGLDDLDRVLLTTTDSLVDRQGVDDELWTRLAAHLSTEQVIDVLYTVGQYLTIATVINTLGVRTEGDLALPLPRPAARKEVPA